jgi:hypothetical protein
MTRSYTENKSEQNTENKKYSEEIVCYYFFSLSNIIKKQIRIYLLRIKNFEKFTYLIRI